MKQRALKPLSETKYLSAENAWRYRVIMRTFYAQYLKYKQWMSKEEVYEVLREDPAFSDYEIDACRQDLDQLTGWGNLTAVQDTSRVATYEQFMNKQFRYQMTEYAIEIERMTVKLENLLVERGSLEPTLLERIRESIERLGEMDTADEKTLNGWWSQLTHDFQRLNQNYQDYIRDWNSVKMEELMKTSHFLVYKEKLIDYLRHFIKELQNHAHAIERHLQAVDAVDLEGLFERLTNHEMEIPRVDMEKIGREELKANIRGKYESIEGFFTGAESEVEIILSMTNEIIRRITRYAASILELSSQFSSRREEYRKVMELFMTSVSIDEAHRLSAQVFGIDSYKHFCGEQTRSTESIQSSVYVEEHSQVILSPRVRTYRERMNKTAIVDHAEDKRRMLERVIAEREEEQEILHSYLSDGRVVFETLSDVPGKIRRTLLRWLVKGLREKGHTTVTEHGLKYRVTNPEEKRRCKVIFEDGELNMPAYVMEFEVES